MMVLTSVAWWILGACVAVMVYSYIAYPILLRVAALFLRRRAPSPDGPLPMISITIPAYNEEAAIAATLDRVLAADYPADRIQVVVVSDGSTDRTDEIARGYADRGVQLVVMPTRSGKTAAENAVQRHLVGEVVINTDASVAVHKDALLALAREFADPMVGVASSRDVSVARVADLHNIGEAGYVGYEMWVRDCETRTGGIVGASGSLYAIRAALHRTLVPEALSRDFASAMIAHEHGCRSVSVPGAICFVPRARSLRREYKRKVRTMTRGLETLWYKRHLLNPLRHGLFAFKLLSHKLFRWLVPWACAISIPMLAVLAIDAVWARVVLGLALLFIGAGLVGWMLPEEKPVPRILSLPAYVCSGLLAGLHAWINALSGELNPLWEPTRRDPIVIK